MSGSGLEQFSDARKRGSVAVQRGSNGRTTNEWLLLKGITKVRGNAATTNGCKLYENMQMQCA